MGVQRNKNSGSHIFEESQTPLQVVRWTEQRVAVTTTVSSQRLTLPTGADLIEITAVEPVYINFGDNTVDASSTIASDGSRIFLAGVQVVQVPIDPATDLPYTHLAVIWLVAAGVFQVEELD